MAGYLQVVFDIEREQSVGVSLMIEDLGALSITIKSGNEQECFDESSPSEPLWEKQCMSALFQRETDFENQVASLTHDISNQLVDLYQGTSSLVPKLIFENIPDKDWERAWLDEFKPIKVGHKLWVCPTWCSPVEPGHQNLLIDPGLAFGTGTHPTTQLCLTHLSTETLNGKTVLDFGCGSGILGIAAAKLGALETFGTDVDSKAVDAANANSVVNQVSDKFEAMMNETFFRQVGDQKFDLVIANILAGTLIELVDELISRTALSGRILLSGILHHQADAVIAAYCQHFDFKKNQSGDWMLLVGEKHGS